MDNIVEEFAKIAQESLRQADAINKKLVMIVFALIIAMCLTTIGVTATFCGFYFLSDYAYPEITQDTSQQDSAGAKQEVNQTIKKGGVE